jgi:1-acyl-sn-glycerol-3-phosphate acyltransferase
LIRLPVKPSAEVLERVELLELPFNRHGIDPFGISKEEIARAYTISGWFLNSYFKTSVYGTDYVPPRGRTMMVGNHSGGVALDAMMVLASTFFHLEPPRLAQGMAEKFLNRFPVISEIFSRMGQFTGIPEHAARLLQDERMLLVFPEGARGTAKLYHERDSLVRFGTGFMRLALETKSPIVPFAFVGGGEAIPTIANLYRVGKIFGVPYIPVTPWLFPVPRPVDVRLLYSKPMVFEGTGREDDVVIRGYIEQVKDRIASLIEQGRQLQKGRLDEAELVLE